MSHSYAKEPRIILQEGAKSKNWGDDFRDPYNNLQIYHISNGIEGAQITDAKNIKFPEDLLYTYWVNADLRGAYLRDKKLRGANLKNVDLDGAYLWNTSLQDVNLTGAKLTNIYLENNSTTGPHWAYVNLTDATLINIDLENANLAHAILKDAKLLNINLECANLTAADLTGANLKEVKLAGAQLPNATLINATFENLSLERANLNNADLEGANLKKVFLQSANLRGANFTNATLSDIDLGGTDLTNAVFKNATLDYDILFQTEYWERVDFENTKIRRNGKTLPPEESRDIIKARMDELNITNARGLEEKTEPYDKVKYTPTDMTMARVTSAGVGALAAAALIASFMEGAEPDPFKGMSFADQEVVCASAAARKVPSTEKACAKAGLTLPAPDLSF